MTADLRWTPETLYLARNAHARHSFTVHGPDEDEDDFGWDWTCTCDAAEDGFNMWGAAQDSATAHQMTATLTALADAGLLLPPGGEVREEKRHRSTWSNLPCGGPDLKCTMPDHHEVRTVHTGPWREAANV